ncbi:uncharacterized protein LOC135951970 [Calliphora vicina]|uniref:uncharacterized protein LOC135951970 n=1 Tax=Calliphora vicina TaxID=7373 RepID=UPI00325BAC3B
MFTKLVLLFMISCLDYCMTHNTTDDFNGSSVMTMFERKSRANLVSFEPLGEHIQLGMDFLLPFIKVPIVRTVDAYGNEPALININTAALVSTGLLATSSALISYIFRRYVVLGREESSSEKRRRSDNDLEFELWSALNNFKLIYTNSSGARVDTSLAGLFETINETFENNDIDLSSCIQKAICKRIHLSARRVNEGDSSGVDKIIDGLMGIKWLRNSLRHTSLKDAVDARDAVAFSKQRINDNKQPVYCDKKYPQCKWSVPEDNLIDIISTYLKFT